jgi:ArsR family transcriptional regulator, cadmium/lead-responsive transcriptional repressor
LGGIGGPSDPRWEQLHAESSITGAGENSEADSRYHRPVTITPDGTIPRVVDLSAAVALFRSLADPTRLAIVRELAAGERRVVDLTRKLGLAQSTVSAHVACLRDCGLVDGRPVGRQMLYRLTRPELLSVLSVAEQLLAATGNAVALCPVFGEHDEQRSVGA